MDRRIPIEGMKDVAFNDPGNATWKEGGKRSKGWMMSTSREETTCKHPSTFSLNRDLNPSFSRPQACTCSVA
jgi:hypothetical protein